MQPGSWHEHEARRHRSHLPADVLAYDCYVVAFSGGKDSVALVLHLLELGVPAEEIELWHHLVDGREGSALVDWPCTTAYCQAFADALGLRIYYSWKQGGFEGEMLRENARTRPIHFEQPDGTVATTGGTGGPSTAGRRTGSGRWKRGSSWRNGDVSCPMNAASTCSTIPIFNPPYGNTVTRWYGANQPRRTLFNLPTLVGQLAELRSCRPSGIFPS